MKTASEITLPRNAAIYDNPHNLKRELWKDEHVVIAMTKEALEDEWFVRDMHRGGGLRKEMALCGDWVDGRVIGFKTAIKESERPE